MSINNPSEPAAQEEIDSVVDVLIDYLRSDTGTDLIVRLRGFISEQQVKDIEEELLLVTGRRVQLTHHFYDQPEDGEAEGGYTVLGTVELIS